LKVLQFKTPTPETEHMFEASFNATLEQYGVLLKEERETQKPAVTNDNFDLGAVSGPGKYQMSDTAHAKLLDELANQKFAGTTPEIRAELLDFFSASDTPFAMKKDAKVWAKVQSELEELKNAAIEQKTATAVD
jgi:hypothetical protein